MQTKKTTKIDSFRLSGDWGRQSTFLQGQFPELTDDDLEFEEGKEDELIKRIELRLNKKHDEVVNFLKKGQLATF
ncbi:general stress protein CsbD [Aquiflexum sp. TKW24L]|uniref:general stress protein CsbD n=1 Tax=Aquiflexum sp. TKW24L TaxID=2942212 RepID=UPI0020BD5114|nr:general stress protein CsbD [Aquiflexum sp. TKW24L]MCL6259810.1 general stress protein CsbD [Aquiflexum sp. TKW24L]